MTNAEKFSEQTNEKVLPLPCTKVKEKTTKEWLQKVNEELDELKEAIFDPDDYLRRGLEKEYDQNIAEEAADTITAITSMLQALGIDEERRQDAQKRVNERNKERGRF